MKQIKCSECNKEYDIKLNVCPHCGYENKNKKIINIILYVISAILVIISLLSILENVFINKFTSGLQDYLIEAEVEELSNTLGYVAEAYKTDGYIEKYGSKTYGEIAYNLSNIRTFSMCFCILFIWIGVYLKNKNIKFSNVIKYIAIAVFIIFQLIPFVYDICICYIRV